MSPLHCYVTEQLSCAPATCPRKSTPHAACVRAAQQIAPAVVRRSWHESVCPLRGPAWCTDEKALIAGGEMTTWMQHAFGGDKTVMLPTAYSFSNSSSIHVPPNVMKDNSTGKWWSCRDFAYDITACPTCQGPHMRCVSHYKLAFRCGLQAMELAIGTCSAAGYVKLRAFYSWQPPDPAVEPYCVTRHKGASTLFALSLTTAGCVVLQVCDIHVLGIHHHDDCGLW
jgi:ribosomal protein L37E